MIAKPKKIDKMDKLIWPYFLEDGNSSAREIYSIMPATMANIIPKINSLIKGFKNRKDKNAPNGSAIPDKKEYFIALYLLLVE